MGQYQFVQASYLSQPRIVKRTGVAADLATQHTVNLFTVAGGDVLVTGIYGKVIVAKDATAQTLRLGHVPTIGGVEAFLCAASATTSADAIDSIYTISGVATDLMIVAQIGTAIGIGQMQSSPTGIGTGNPLVLVPGILRLTTAAANDILGLINWTVIYIALSSTSLVTVL